MHHIIKSIVIFLIYIPSALFSDDEWGFFKHQTITTMKDISGWCSNEKALLMMDIIKENKCKCCVEVGVFAGKSLLPIAKALAYNGKGKIFAVDSWSASEARQGFQPTDHNYAWWNNLDFDDLYKQTIALINKNKLGKFCRIIKKSSHRASSLFDNEIIDFIHLDGNHNEDYAFQDIVDYFPKVKNGGYILLNDPNWYSLKRSLVFLLERADLISSFSPRATYFLFRKNNKRAHNASILFNSSGAQT